MTITIRGRYLSAIKTHSFNIRTDHRYISKFNDEGFLRTNYTDAYPPNYIKRKIP